MLDNINRVIDFKELIFQNRKLLVYPQYIKLVIAYYGEGSAGNKEGDMVQVQEWFATEFRQLGCCSCTPSEYRYPKI